ncbi:hypothetical protein ACFS5J_12100 [Flavobacterium chuncheonense]|uniref:Uncharacterized protein n=1 Tax=Flavobacterium chuncheonense TaxID=2026653 RepID=A0ABW5YNY3_9FLAO
MKRILTLVLLCFSFTFMGQNFHTEFNYTDSTNNGITIQNSYPKGGLSYTDFDGKKYVYVIFWTSITNKTKSEIELTIDFPITTFGIQSSPSINFQLYLPFQKMTFEKDSLFNYGLDINMFFNNKENKRSSLRTTIAKNETYNFYIVLLNSQGINGIVRTGFELEHQNLIYKINGQQMNCGTIVPKKIKYKFTSTFLQLTFSFS